MKRLFVFMLTLFVVACGGSGGSSGSGTTARTPMDPHCINSSTACNNLVYGHYTGWTPYTFPYGGTNYNYQNYFNLNGVCGCPLGYMPAYNSSMGLGCYRSNSTINYTWNISFAFSFYAPPGFYAPQTQINQPQVSNIPNAGAGNCSRNVATSCLMNQANSCGAGATCREVLVGSGLGVCVSPSYGYW